jgi:hypothetical protein
MFDFINYVKYKHTHWRKKQKWPHEFDWWLSHRKIIFRNTAMPPEIECDLQLNLSLLNDMFLDITLYISLENLEY